MKGTNNILEQTAKKLNKSQIIENWMTKTLKGGRGAEPPPFEVQL